jgi:hypothetical protein
VPLGVGEARTERPATKRCVEAIVDGVDSKVIGCLLRNARGTPAEIGADVGLSAPPR